MAIDSLFLNVEFTKITLLHILLLLGFPYILFYTFQRYTKFDYFSEKWEAALFVFIIGGTIALLSILLIQFGFPFWFSYILLILMSSFLLIIFILSYSNKKNSDVGCIKVRLKNNELYTGIYGGEDVFGIHLISEAKDKIKKEINDVENNINAKEIIFKWNQILAILYY